MRASIPLAALLVFFGARFHPHPENGMIIKDTESVDVHTSTGPMRTYLFRPATEGRYPGLLLKNNSYTGIKGKANVY